MTELKKSKMDLPPAPGKDEDAKLEFGTLVKPSFAQETGLRIPSGSTSKQSLTWKYGFAYCGSDVFVTTYNS